VGKAKEIDCEHDYDNEEKGTPNQTLHMELVRLTAAPE
jgi:hypothetical protein